jgi:hypothetical protein
VDALEDLARSGRLVDVALAFMLVEALVLVARRRRRGGGLDARAVAALLLPGACLLLALRAALTGAAAGTIALWLLTALAAHLGDLAARWPRR